MSPAFLVGCDGDREWCCSKSDRNDGPYYHERDLKNIREKYLSFLDPFSCVDATQEQVKEHFQKRGIKYLGETEFEDKPLHLFGCADSNNRSESQYEIAIDAETLLPFYTRVLTNSGSFGPINTCYHFEIKSTDKPFAVTDFQQTVDKESKPKIMNKPDEGTTTSS